MKTDTLAPSALAAEIQKHMKQQSSGWTGAVDIAWSRTSKRMTGGTYKNKGMFKGLCDSTLAEAKKMRPADREKRIDAAVRADKPAQPMDKPAYDACARHMAWAIVDAYYVCGGK